MVGTKVFNSQDVVTYCSDKVWVESLVFIVNDEGISYKVNDIRDDIVFHSQYTGIGKDINAFIRNDNHEVLIFRYSNTVYDWFVDFLFKLWEVIKKQGLHYSGVYHILEHNWYNVLDYSGEDGEINEIADIDIGINNFIVSFIIIGLSPVYSVNSGARLTDVKVFYGKELKSVEFRSTVTHKDGVTSFYNTRRYILSYDSNSRSYYLKE